MFRLTFIMDYVSARPFSSVIVDQFTDLYINKISFLIQLRIRG